MRAFLMLLLLAGVPALAAEALPNDVSSFLELRASCDHWRGEYV